MASADLQSFLRHLESQGELHRVTVPVDAELEITEIAIRSLRDGGPALLFENVAGSDYPLAINVLGSARRIEMALGIDPAELGERIVQFVDRMNPPTLKALWQNRAMARRFLKFRPGKARRAPVQQVVDRSPDLGRLPVLKCWPGDGGRFFTLPLVITNDPETGVRNVGMYRMHVYDGRTTGMHMQIERGGGFHYHSAEKLGRALPVAVALGGDPALWIAAVTPLPEGIDEVAFAGLLKNRRTPMTRAATIEIQVPAQAEFVLEGEVPVGERRLEGPFGDHFGHYSRRAEFPVFHVRAVTHRRNPVYPATVVGKPPQEDRYIGDATQEVMKPLARLVHREISDLWAYFEAGYHNLLAVGVETRYEKEPLKTAFGLLGMGQLALTKIMVLVNPDVNVRSFPALLRAIRRNFDPREDFQLLARAPHDTLDFTGEAMHRGSKMIIDATGDSPAPGGAVPLPGDLRAIAPAAIKWRFLEQTLLVVQVEREPRAAMEALVRSPLLEHVTMIAVVSPDVDLEDETELLWGLFTRFDPARDVVFARTEMRGSLPVYSGAMGIDASHKASYPRPLEMDAEIVARVDRRWGEYFGRG